MPYLFTFSTENTINKWKYCRTYTNNTECGDHPPERVGIGEIPNSKDTGYNTADYANGNNIKWYGSHNFRIQKSFFLTLFFNIFFHGIPILYYWIICQAIYTFFFWKVYFISSSATLTIYRNLNLSISILTGWSVKTKIKV